MSDADVAQRQAETGDEEEEETLQAKPLAEQITPLVQRQEELPEEEETLQARLIQRQAENEEEDEEELQAKFSDGGMLQRMCAGCEDEMAQRQPLEEEEEELQAKSRSGTAPAVAPNLESRIAGLKGGGQPLDPAARAFFEPRFGSDLSQVRVHSDARAGESARALNAEAYTLGRDVVFGNGLYAPETETGRRLLAHELVHVQQQMGRREGTARLQRQERGRLPTREESERVAWHYLAVAESSTSVAEFQAAVEATAATALGAIGADALVFSISGAGGYWAGAGGGYEMVYSPRFGWATYFQLGVGVSTPGGGVALEVGVIWNMGNPRDYRGSFIELAGSFRTWSASGFVSPSSSPTGGIKVGRAIGSDGASLLFEYYWQLTGISALPDIVHRGHYTFFLPPMHLCGRAETFVVQFNTEDARTRRVRVKVLYQRINRREEATFNLDAEETLNPVLLDEGEHMALFDIDGDRVSDLRLVVPNYVLLRGEPGLNIELLYRGRLLRRLSYPGVPVGTLRTGRQYFRIPGTDYRPTGPLYVDECGMAVNDRDR